MSQRTNQELLVAGLFRLASSFPFIFIGPALFIGKGTTGTWYWTAIAVLVMLTGVVLVVMGLRMVLRGFFGERKN